MHKTATRLLLPLLQTVLGIHAASAAVFDRKVPSASQAMELQTPAPTGRIIIKFSDESQVLVAESGLMGGDASTMQRLTGLLADSSSRGTVQRHFNTSMAEIDA